MNRILVTLLSVACMGTLACKADQLIIGEYALDDGGADARGDTYLIPATCGNGIIDPGEECDLGASNGGSNCDGTCKVVTVVTIPTPDPPGVVTLASGQNDPQVIALDSTSVYWANWGDYNSANGSVMKVSVDGGTPVTLVPNLKAPGGIAVDNTSVYWAGGLSDGTWSLTKTPLVGGAGIALSSAFRNDPIVVGGGRVFGSGTDVISVPINGGPVTTLAPAHPTLSGQMSYGYSVDDTYLYWVSFTAPSFVMKIPLGGGVATTLATLPGTGFGTAVDATSVYIATAGGVMKVSKSGGAPTTLAAESGAGIATDAKNVYWTVWSDPGSVNMVSVNGGQVTTLATEQHQPWGIAVDATNVYWVNGGIQGQMGTGSVMKLALSNSAGGG